MFVVYPCAHTELKKISVYTFSDSCYANDIYGIAFFILLFAGVHILYMYYIYILYMHSFRYMYINLYYITFRQLYI